MNRTSRLSVWTVITMIVLKFTPVPAHSVTPCSLFQELSEAFNASMEASASGLPASAGESVRIAWDLVESADACLKENGIQVDRISTYALKIRTGDENPLALAASQLVDMTGGAVIYDVGFFLRKPFAAGGFEHNTLYLPHSAVHGQIDMVVRHEFSHARAHALMIRGKPRLRNLWVFGDDTMYVDEVLAYAEGALHAENAMARRTWSRAMAHEYIATTRSLIRDAASTVSIGQNARQCALEEPVREKIINMLDCVDFVLTSEDSEVGAIAACDGPTHSVPVCSE